MLQLTLLLAALAAAPARSGERGAKTGVAPATPAPVVAPIPALGPSLIGAPAVPGAPSAPAETPAATLQQNAAIAAASHKAVTAPLPSGLGNAWTKLGVGAEQQNQIAAAVESAYPPSNTPSFHGRESSHEIAGVVSAMLAAVPESELGRSERATILLASLLYAADPMRPEGSLPRNAAVLEHIEKDPALAALMKELGVAPAELAAYAAALGYASSVEGKRRLEEQVFVRALDAFPPERQAQAGLWTRRLRQLRAALPFIGNPNEVRNRLRLLAAESRRTASLALGRTVEQPSDLAVATLARALTAPLKDSPDDFLFPEDARRMLEMNLEPLRPEDEQKDLAPRTNNASGKQAVVKVGRAARGGMSAQIDIDYGDGQVIQFAQTNRGRRELAGWSRFGHNEQAAAYPEELVDPESLKDLSVLDVGTGEGAFVLDLRRAGVNALGVDARLRPGLQRMPGVFYEADGQSLPFPDGSLDRLYSNWSIPLYFHEENNFYPFLQEWARVLKKGGRLRLSPVHPDNYPLILVEMKKLGLALSPDLKLKRVGRHNRGPFIGMLYEIFWKGKEWRGDPFLELVKTR